MANRVTSQTGVNLIMKFEGCRLKAYRCAAGVLTIGYGHTGSDVTEGLQITQARAEALLKKDLQRFENYVNSAVYVPLTEKLTQGQFDALVSFSFNCGNGSLKSLCKGRTLPQICEAMMKYNKAKVKGVLTVLAGLTRRRAAEQALFNSNLNDATATKADVTNDAPIVVSNNCLMLQKAIVEDGIDHLELDGKCGNNTKDAIRKISLNAKFDSTINKYIVGSKGAVVRFVQSRLGLTEDGLYGAGTRNSVIEWQNEHGLTPDGIAGPVTLLTMI